MNPASNQQPPIALPTKDGLSLSYDYAKATHRILMTWETESFKKALGKAKEQRPRIDAFSGTLNGIFLDFDDLVQEGQSGLLKSGERLVHFLKDIIEQKV